MTIDFNIDSFVVRQGCQRTARSTVYVSILLATVVQIVSGWTALAWTVSKGVAASQVTALLSQTANGAGVNQVLAEWQ